MRKGPSVEGDPDVGPPLGSRQLPGSPRGSRVMLRVADFAARSDTGRQRRANEDSYLASSPIFVVADGMGGARAGEVASRLAVESYEQGLPEAAQSPEDGLAQRARAANARIHELSQRDRDLSGMGTTLTAIYADAEHVSIAHVGDSRAYRLRDGQLERMTEDHSLVAELVRQGRLTAQEAAEHPQRSIITRALGPEPDVAVDTRRHDARPGDLYLICSDGLTSMLDEQQVADILRCASDLERAGRELIRAANEAGGNDNITVVLFTLAEAATGLEDGSRVGTSPPSPPPAPASPPPGVDRRLPRMPPPPPRGRRRWPVALISVLAALGLVGAGGYVASQTVYFIGTNTDGLVTMYRGLPFDLPGGVRLYTTNYVSGVGAQTLAPGRQRRLLDHKLRSHDDAASLVRALERGQVSG